MVTRADVFPVDHGAAVKIDRTASGLSRVAGPVYLVTDDRAFYHRYLGGKRETVRFPRWLRSFGPWRRAMRARLRLAGVPAQDAFLYFALRDWNLALRAAYVAARHGLRMFQAEFPAYARICLWVKSLLGGCAVLVEHNVEFERLRDQVPDLSAKGYGFLRDIELALCRQVDAVVTVSQRDRATLLREGVDPAKIIVIPHGVDISAFEHATAPGDLLLRRGVPPGRPVLVYHGTYLYPPNLEAMRFVAEELLPRLHEKGCHPAVIALGPNPPKGVLHPDLFFLGSVDSVAPYLKAAGVAVVPLQQGGGTRMKVLDYFAAAIPVVSTSKGVEGLGLVDGAQVWVRDGAEAFADAILELLVNPAQARAMGVEGRRYVEQFDWVNIARRYADLFGRLCERR